MIGSHPPVSANRVLLLVSAPPADPTAADRTEPRIRVVVDRGPGGSESHAVSVRAQRPPSISDPIGVVGNRGTFAADSVYLVLHWLPDSVNATRQSCLPRYRRLNHPEASLAEAMRDDAVMLLALAVREVGSDHRRIREWLALLGSSRSAYRGDSTVAADRPLP